QIVARKTVLTESAAPASAKQVTAPIRLAANPSATTARAQAAAAMITAAPWRFTLDVQPLNTAVARLPNDIADYKYPAAEGPAQDSAIAGNSATGIAKVIAMMSTVYVPISSGRLFA